jgi:hypothetical protein
MEKRLGHGDHRVFRGVVGAHPWPGDQPADRCGVDHMSLALGDEVRHEGADSVHYAEQVDAHGPVPDRQRDLPGRAAAGDPRVVADHVRRTEAPDGAAGQVVDRARVAHIGHGGGHLDTVGRQAGRRGRQRWFLDVRHHDPHPVAAQAPAQRQADAAGRAGYHRDLARQIPHDVVPSCLLGRSGSEPATLAGSHSVATSLTCPQPQARVQNAAAGGPGQSNAAAAGPGQLNGDTR